MREILILQDMVIFRQVTIPLAALVCARMDGRLAESRMPSGFFRNPEDHP
jgi:hypothetical protein